MFPYFRMVCGCKEFVANRKRHIFWYYSRKMQSSTHMDRVQLRAVGGRNAAQPKCSFDSDPFLGKQTKKGTRTHDAWIAFLTYRIPCRCSLNLSDLNSKGLVFFHCLDLFGTIFEEDLQAAVPSLIGGFTWWFGGDKCPFWHSSPKHHPLLPRSGTFKKIIPARDPKQCKNEMQPLYV